MDMKHEDVDRQERIFADLESQYALQQREEVRAQAAMLERAERTVLTLMDRIAASLGERVVVHSESGTAYAGTIREYGADWLRLETPGTSAHTYLALGRMVWVTGLSVRARETEARSPRHSFRRIFERWAQDHAYLHVRLGDREVQGVLVRAWADHIDIDTRVSAANVGTPKSNTGTYISMRMAVIEAVRVMP